MLQFLTNLRIWSKKFRFVVYSNSNQILCHIYLTWEKLCDADLEAFKYNTVNILFVKFQDYENVSLKSFVRSVNFNSAEFITHTRTAPVYHGQRCRFASEVIFTLS
jgi:hypothetical protein